MKLRISFEDFATFSLKWLTLIFSYLHSYKWIFCSLIKQLIFVILILCSDFSTHSHSAGGLCITADSQMMYNVTGLLHVLLTEDVCSVFSGDLYIRFGEILRCNTSPVFWTWEEMHEMENVEHLLLGSKSVTHEETNKNIKKKHVGLCSPTHR